MDKNTARRIKQIHDAAMSSSREQECTSCSPSNFLLDQRGSPKPGISSFQLIRVRKKKKGHGSRKVFIFSKTYKENFVFLRGGETRGKAETSGKDSTITTSRCFFLGGEIYFGIEMKMTTKCHKGICQMSVGKGIARENGRPERVTNRTLVEKAAICRFVSAYIALVCLIGNRAVSLRADNEAIVNRIG